jgi:hypothetical protein
VPRDLFVFKASATLARHSGYFADSARSLQKYATGKGNLPAGSASGERFATNERGAFGRDIFKSS